MKNAKFGWLFLLLLMVILSVLQCPAVAAEPASQKPAKKDVRDRRSKPITVKSNELKADNKARMATFSGKVVARQDDVTIYADKLVIYYGEQSEQVDKIEAFGSVRILQENRIGTGGYAVYSSLEGKVTLSDNPKVVQGTDSITGKVIVYYLDEERSDVTGGDNTRVEAVIHPKQGSGLGKNGTGKKP